jgi:hypothetical protein
VFPAMPTITPFATSCSNGSPDLVGPYEVRLRGGVEKGDLDHGQPPYGCTPRNIAGLEGSLVDSHPVGAR